MLFSRRSHTSDRDYSNAISPKGPKQPTYQVSPQTTYRPHTQQTTQHNRNGATTNSRNLFLVVPYSNSFSKDSVKPAGV